MAVSWGQKEEVALVQIIALFGELKTNEWPSFGSKHEYWDKAADFIQETVGSTYKRSSKTEKKLLFNFHLDIVFSFVFLLHHHYIIIH